MTAKSILYLEVGTAFLRAGCLFLEKSFLVLNNSKDYRIYCNCLNFGIQCHYVLMIKDNLIAMIYYKVKEGRV